jgi:uncharacterized membrane protein YedE/YeeE
MTSAIALCCGIIFGIGLALSGMVDPVRVVGFLDVAGKWDPTLAFVMVSALIPAFIGFALTRRLRSPIAATSFELPPKSTMDGKLVAGASLFGVGWGLVGLCPGPALTDITFENWKIWVFIAAMASGMGLHRLFRDSQVGAFMTQSLRR